MVLQTDAPASVTEPLVEGHPGEIELRDEPVPTFNRRDDTPPFWGGGSIKSGGAVCTSGFTVQKPSGQRFITTAAHCFGVGASVTTTDGNMFVGGVTERAALNRSSSGTTATWS